MESTGERYVPSDASNNNNEYGIEHLQRYKFVLPYLKDKFVLDAACGEGYGSDLIAQKAKNVIGIDISDEAINHAEIKYQRNNLKFIESNIDNLPFEDASFDAVVSFETIEHVPEEVQLSFIKEVRRVLKKDGIFIISTPNKRIAEKYETSSKFHVKELYPGELTDYLKSGFEHINLYNQYHESSCFLLPDGSSEVYAKITGTDKRPRDEAYIIAVASSVKQSLWEGRVTLPSHQIFYETKLKLRKTGPATKYATVFYDTGKGFNQQESKVFPMDNENFSEYIGLKPNVKAIRFDPIEGLGCIVNKLEINSDSGPLKYHNLNGYSIGKYHLFLTKDPQFLIVLSPGISWLSIDAQIYSYDSLGFVGLFSQIKKLIVEAEGHSVLIERSTREKEELQQSMKKNLAKLKQELLEETIAHKEQKKAVARLLADQQITQKMHHIELNNEITRIKNSIRYRIGEAFIKAARPSADTLKLPNRLIGLLLESKNSNKSNKSINSNKSNKSINSNGKKISHATQNKPPNFYEFHRAFDSKSCCSSVEALENKISIIVPIYNAYNDVKQCIESVMQHTHINHEILLIDDCSPDPKIKELLDHYKSLDYYKNMDHYKSLDHYKNMDLYKNKKNIRILRNEVNLGFVKTVNRGLTETTGDVILLNSDTIVTERWALKLLISAYSDNTIGTVTPLSNAAGVFSVPESGVENTIPAPLTLSKMAKLVESDSTFTYPEVPTGNGFCLYIKRDAILQTGLFDAETFTRGYGEENDFCMRAGYKGWKHIINDSVYIYHKRGASFKSEKELLIDENLEKLNKLHPSYSRLTNKYITKSTSLKRIREKIGHSITDPADLVLKDKKNILFVLHDEDTGGTQNTNKDLMSNIQHDHNCYLLTVNGRNIKLWTYKDNELTALKEFPVSKWNINEFYKNDYRDLYFNILVNFNISIVHIRHLLSHTFDLPKIAALMGVPCVLSFHDFYLICPSIQLIDGNGSYCGAMCNGNSFRSYENPYENSFENPYENSNENPFENPYEDPCINPCKSPYKAIGIHDLRGFVPRWRKEVTKMLSFVNGFVTTSPYVKQLFCDIYPNLKNKDFRVIEHGRDFETIGELTESPKPGEKIKILILGHVNYHKGGDFIQKLKVMDEDNILEFHFLGGLSPKYAILKMGIDYGKYTREDLPHLIESIKPSFAGIFSVWPETYCHTLSEVWAYGLPAFVSNIGVLRERVLKNKGGWLVDFNDPQGAYKKIMEIAGDKYEYKRVKERVKRIKLRTIDEMSLDYRAMYFEYVYKFPNEDIIEIKAGTDLKDIKVNNVADLKDIKVKAGSDLKDIKVKDWTDLKDIKVAVQAHIFNIELVDEILENLRVIPFKFDCYISTDCEEKKREIAERFDASDSDLHLNSGPHLNANLHSDSNLYSDANPYSESNLYIEVFENRGRDVAPFLIQMKNNSYDYICHIHTKKSRPGDYGESWRKYLYKHLLGSPENVTGIIKLFEDDPKLGLLFPKTYPPKLPFLRWGKNYEDVRMLFDKLKMVIELPVNPIFPAGNMFWARTSAVSNIFELGLKSGDFPVETGTLYDGTLAHAIERLWVYLVQNNGYKHLQTVNATQKNTDDNADGNTDGNTDRFADENTQNGYFKRVMMLSDTFIKN